MSVRVDRNKLDAETRFIFDQNKVMSRLNRKLNKAQYALDAAILKDSNYYCPQDTGTLQRSAIIHTVLGSGLVRWVTPYAKKQYHGFPTKRTGRNPNAVMKWFEVAKAARLEEWVRVANGEFIK